MEDSLWFPTKLGIFLLSDSSNILLVFTQRSWKQCLHKKLHIVYSSFIYNCQHLEVTKMFFSRQMDKQTVVHLDNGKIFNAEMKWAISFEKTWRNRKPMLLSERSQSDKAIHCIISNMWHSSSYCYIFVLVSYFYFFNDFAGLFCLILFALRSLWCHFSYAVILLSYPNHFVEWCASVGFLSSRWSSLTFFKKKGKIILLIKYTIQNWHYSHEYSNTSFRINYAKM